MWSAARAAVEKLRAHAGFRRYAANTSWMFAEQALRLAAGVLVGVWVARYLGPEKFGQYSYAIAFVAIFAGIAKLGLDSVLVRELVREPDRADDYLGTAFWLKLAGALAAFGVVAAAQSGLGEDRLTGLYILIIAAGMVFQASEVIDFYFQARVLSRFVSICRMAQLALSSLLKLYLIFTHAGLLPFVLVTLFDQAALAVSLHLAHRIHGAAGFVRRFDPEIARRLLADSWPLVFSSMVVMVYMRIDQLMIKGMLGERDVGLYSAAVRLGEMWYFIPVVVTNSVFPAIVAARRDSAELYRARLQQLYTLMLWLSIAVALPMTLLSGPLVTALYGAAFADAGPVLRVMIWAGLFVSLGVASGSWLISENLPRLAFYRTLAGALVNIALNLVLIPAHGILGAAIATVISYMVAGLLFDLFHPQTRPMFRMKLRALALRRT